MHFIFGEMVLCDSAAHASCNDRRHQLLLFYFGETLDARLFCMHDCLTDLEWRMVHGAVFCAFSYNCDLISILGSNSLVGCLKLVRTLQSCVSFA